MQFTLQTLFLLFVVLWTSLALFDPLGIVAFLVVVVLAVSFRFFKRQEIVISIVILGVLIALLLPAQSQSREVARLAHCVQNLDRIATALRAYRAEHGRYPPVCITDAAGKPIHSWRTALVPYLGETKPQPQYDFDQPWDSVKNLQVIGETPQVFACPTSGDRFGGETTYFALTGAGTAWTENIGADSDKRFRPDQLVLVVEVANHGGVRWTEPRDSTPECNVPVKGVMPPLGLASEHRDRAHVLCADGSVRWIHTGSLKALPSGALTVGAADPVDWKKLDAPVLNPKGFSRSTWNRLAALPIWLLSSGVLLYRAWRSRKAAMSNAGDVAVESTIAGS
ncbi:MAG: DUF1559 domain-containing protein [Thermoguttaceae bacterium]